MDWQVKSDGEENSAWHSHITGSSPFRLNSGSRMYSFFVEMFGMGTGRGMSLVSSHMRGNSPVNGSLLWHFKLFFVLPEWVHVQTIKEVSWFISQGNVFHHTICDKVEHFPFSICLFLFWRPALLVVLVFSCNTFFLSLMCFLSGSFLGLHVILNLI